MKKNYKILKCQENQNGEVEAHYVNDSEGIPIEWENREDAEVMVEKFQINSKDRYTYIVIG